MSRILQVISVIAGLVFIGFGIVNSLRSGNVEWNDFGLAAFFLALPLAIRWLFNNPRPKSDGS